MNPIGIAASLDQAMTKRNAA